MMAKPENPPAFPCDAMGDRSVPPEHDYIQTGIHTAKFPGMSLRDWFAGHLAAAEVASAGANYDAAEALADAATKAGMTIPQRIAFNAYEVADALLAARHTPDKIGRASCRERVCQYLSLSVVSGSIKKKKHRTNTDNKP